MVGWSGQNRGLKADSCGFQKLSVVYSNSKNSGGQTHPKFAPKTMKPCQQTKTPLWVRSRPLDSPESEFNVRKSQDDGLPLEPCAISGGGCLMFPQLRFLFPLFGFGKKKLDSIESQIRNLQFRLSLLEFN